jgi:membrane glycosyltransferase
VKPFIEHCALAPLPGEGSFAGSILSHDFVEAALMRRAGWGVWIAYDLPGSYEDCRRTCWMSSSVTAAGVTVT